MIFDEMRIGVKNGSGPSEILFDVLRPQLNMIRPVFMAVLSSGGLKYNIMLLFIFFKLFP